LPALCQSIGFLFQINQLFFKTLQAILRSFIILFFQRFPLNLQLNNPAVQLIQLFRLGIHLHAQAAGGLINKVDGLIRQEAVCDVAVRQRCCGNNRAIGDAHTMVKFILLLDTAQNGDGIFNRWLTHKHRLETTGQCRIFLNVLAVLIQRGRTNTMQLTTCQSRLEQVGSVHRSVCLTSANKRMHFVDEQDDPAISGLHFIQNTLQALFKFTTILRTSNQRTHIKC